MQNIPLLRNLKSLRDSLFEIDIKPQEIKKSFGLKVPKKAKMILSNLSIPVILTAAEHLAYSVGVDVSSIFPWQYVITTGALYLTYEITRRYVNQKRAPIHSLGNFSIIPILFDAESYGLFYLRNKGNVGKIGEWAGKVFPSPIAKILASPVSESMPIPLAYWLGVATYGIYLGLQSLDKKFEVVKKTKNKLLSIYDKIYDFYQSSLKTKYLVRLGTSATLVASGDPVMVAAPLTAWFIVDSINKIKRLL